MVRGGSGDPRRDGLLVRFDKRNLVRALLNLLLLNRANDAERGTARSDNVLVCHGEEVALLKREVTSRALGNRLHVLHHLIVPACEQRSEGDDEERGRETLAGTYPDQVR